MGLSKVELSNGETLVDLTEDTVTAETLGEGATAHNSKGEEIVGTMKSGDMLKSVYDTDGDGKVDNANNSEKLGGRTFEEVSVGSYINSLIASGVLADATCNDDGVIIPKSEQLVTMEIDRPWFEVVDYYPMEFLQYLINSGKNAVITLNIGKAFVFEEGKQLKLPIKYYDGTIVETVIRGSLHAFPSRLEGLTAYTLVLGLRGAKLNAEGKFDSIAGWITGIRAEDSVKLEGLTHMDIVAESVASTGTLPRGICDENGVISPDEPWFEFDEESIQRGEVTPNAYDFIWLASFTGHIILSVKADIEPVDGKLPLKIKANFFREEIPNTIIDVPANSPLKADKTYHFIVDSRSAEVIEPEDGFKVKITGLKGAIIGLDPETDTVPTEGSTNLITSGAVYDVIGDINSILDNVNGEVV